MDTEIYTERGDVKRHREKTVIYKTHPSLTALRRDLPCGHLILDFHPPGL